VAENVAGACLLGTGLHQRRRFPVTGRVFICRVGHGGVAAERKVPAATAAQIFLFIKEELRQASGVQPVPRRVIVGEQRIDDVTQARLAGKAVDKGLAALVRPQERSGARRTQRSRASLC